MNDDGSSVTVSLERKEYKIAYSPESPEYKDAIADIRSWQLSGYFEIPMETLRLRRRDPVLVVAQDLGEACDHDLGHGASCGGVS